MSSKLPTLGNFSHFSFHRALWSPGDLAATAARMGYTIVGLADIGGFFGAVDFFKAAQRHCLRPILGCRLWSDRMGWLQFTIRTEQGYRKMNRFLSANHAERVQREDLWRGLLAEVADDLWISLALQTPCAPYPGSNRHLHFCPGGWSAGRGCAQSPHPLPVGWSWAGEPHRSAVRNADCFSNYRSRASTHGSS